MPIIEYDEFSEFQQEHFMFQGQCAAGLDYAGNNRSNCGREGAEKEEIKWIIKEELYRSSDR